MLHQAEGVLLLFDPTEQHVLLTGGQLGATHLGDEIAQQLQGLIGFALTNGLFARDFIIYSAFPKQFLIFLFLRFVFIAPHFFPNFLR